jgi:hypothetical protein
MTTRNPELVEVYRAVEIFAVGAPDARRFHIEESVAEVVHYDGSNADLEGHLSRLAKRAAKVVDWDSEGDTLVATCPDVATCRWLVDRAYELAKR